MVLHTVYDGMGILYLHHDVFSVLVLHQHLHDHVDDAPHVVRAQGDLHRCGRSSGTEHTERLVWDTFKICPITVLRYDR